MAEYKRGLYGVMREVVKDYGTSDIDPKYTVIPSAMDSETQGRNIAMGDLHTPDMSAIRDVAILENEGEVLVTKRSKFLSKANEIKELQAEEAKPEPPKPASKPEEPPAQTITVVADPPQVKNKLILPQTPTQPAYRVPPPTQLVTFKMTEATLGIKYHEVIIKDISLVLAFDERYEAATVPEFAVGDDNKTFTIIVDGYPHVLHCYYYGQHFKHNNYIYTLFVIYDVSEGQTSVQRQSSETRQNPM